MKFELEDLLEDFVEVLEEHGCLLTVEQVVVMLHSSRLGFEADLWQDKLGIVGVVWSILV